jgi:AmmeMemoRadiSam system protein B
VAAVVGPSEQPAGDAGPASVRPPAVAGRFYPGDPERCRQAARALVEVGTSLSPQPADVSAAQRDPDRRWLGAIVPHAGWVCSGAIAGLSVAALAESSSPQRPDIVVVFGAVHTPVRIDFAALDSHARWAVPGGESALDAELGARLAERWGDLFLVEERLHRHEHAVEVELPLIQAAWPAATLLPVEVPLIEDAPTIGRRTAEAVAARGLRRPVFLASSDLTHYGPAYDFAPAGVGVQGFAWAKDNDRRLLDRVTALDADGVVGEVRAHQNACGGGAIAAMLAACRAFGATRAAVLRHANSYETLCGLVREEPDDAVGYASVVVGL